MRKKLFRRIFNDENIPDDGLLHILFEPAVLRMDITVFGYHLFASYSKFFDAYSQAKLKRVFPKDLAAFIDSVLVDPHDFNIYTCNPFNTSNDRYYFDYESDENYTYIWLNVFLKFFRGDNIMDEKTNPTLETTDTSLMPAPIAEVADKQTNIATLTAEIKMYLHIANQSIIEVGKRLIQAKELVNHGDWQNWLKNNFNLSIPTAQKYMQVYNRFGISRIDTAFGSTQLIALLSLPEGDEQKFIAEKAAEGNPADQMSVKQLRAEVKKWKDEFATSEKSNQGLESYISILRNEMVYYRKELDSTKDRARTLSKQLDQQKTVEILPPDYADLQREVKELRERPLEVATEFPPDYESIKHELAQLKNREDSFKKDYAINHALNQIFSLIPTLLNADNLQSVVMSSADNDFSSLQNQLVQLAALHSQLQKHLNVWEDSHINNTPIDRDVIIAELKQLALQDMNNLTSALLLALVKSFGFDDMSQVPDELLPVILRKMKAFHAFLLYM